MTEDKRKLIDNPLLGDSSRDVVSMPIDRYLDIIRIAEEHEALKKENVYVVQKTDTTKPILNAVSLLRKELSGKHVGGDYHREAILNALGSHRSCIKNVLDILSNAEFDYQNVVVEIETSRLDKDHLDKINGVNDKYKKLFDDFSKSADDNFEAAKKDILNKHKEELAKIEAENKKSIEEAKAKKVDLDEEAKIKSKLESEKKALESKVKLLAGAVRKYCANEVDLDELKIKFDRLDKESIRISSENRKYKDQVDELMELVVKKEESINTLSNSAAKLATDNEELMKRNSELESEVNELKDQSLIKTIFKSKKK